MGRWVLPPSQKRRTRTAPTLCITFASPQPFQVCTSSTLSLAGYSTGNLRLPRPPGGAPLCFRGGPKFISSNGARGAPGLRASAERN